ncbi:nuclear transcription factor Y subunit B-4-like [Miscanthus floridulus]|uniref:nuclear transcription factor Y subunit B-4-like n=1 Tax=Miscanthus floridulus TaxID=154761 RepID=UPI00345B0783
MSEAEADDGSGSGGRKELDPPFLPINNIRRVMRSAVPENRKIAKDAKESVQECVSEFISFVTSEASHKCKEEGRKSINGDDIIWSLGTLGFVEYVEPLMLYLMKYREVSFKPPPLSSSSCNPVYSDGTKGSKSSDDQNGKKHNLLNGDPASSRNRVLYMARVSKHAYTVSAFVMWHIYKLHEEAFLAHIRIL